MSRHFNHLRASQQAGCCAVVRQSGAVLVSVRIRDGPVCGRRILLLDDSRDCRFQELRRRLVSEAVAGGRGRLRVDVAGGVGSAQAADRAQGRDDYRDWRWRDDQNGGDDRSGRGRRSRGIGQTRGSLGVKPRSLSLISKTKSF